MHLIQVFTVIPETLTPVSQNWRGLLNEMWNVIKNHKQIYPSICPLSMLLILFRVSGVLEPIPAVSFHQIAPVGIQQVLQLKHIGAKWPFLCRHPQEELGKDLKKTILLPRQPRAALALAVFKCFFFPKNRKYHIKTTYGNVKWELYADDRLTV